MFYGCRYCILTSPSESTIGQHLDKYLPEYARFTGKTIATREAAAHLTDEIRAVRSLLVRRGLEGIRWNPCNPALSETELIILLPTREDIKDHIRAIRAARQQPINPESPASASSSSSSPSPSPAGVQALLHRGANGGPQSDVVAAGSQYFNRVRFGSGAAGARINMGVTNSPRNQNRTIARGRRVFDLLPPPPPPRFRSPSPIAAVNAENQHAPINADPADNSDNEDAPPHVFDLRVNYGASRPFILAVNNLTTLADAVHALPIEDAAVAAMLVGFRGPGSGDWGRVWDEETWGEVVDEMGMRVLPDVVEVDAVWAWEEEEEEEEGEEEG